MGNHLFMTRSKDVRSADLAAIRQASVGWHIQRLAGQLDRAMDEALAPHGLTIQRFAIVMTLVEHDGLTQSQIGARFSAPAYAITRAIDALEADGFLERRPHPTSRRTNTVHATDTSLALVPTLIEIVDDVNGRLMASLDKDQRSALCGVLANLLHNNAL